MPNSAQAAYDIRWPAELENLLSLISGAAFGGCAIVLTGAGSTFGPRLASTDHSGASVSHVRAAASRIDPKVSELAWLIEQLPVPLVSAVNGEATGYACLAALMSDAAIASDGAYFVHPYRSTGAVAGVSLTASLAIRLGKARAMEFIALGKGLPASTAAEWGLIEATVTSDELLQTAIRRAMNLAQDPGRLAGIRQRSGVSTFREAGSS
jgi:2-(1,2-epoxy-1,2-dihydrophenyl)acetyl-CoA isomerase